MKKILIADDSPTIRKLFQFVFRKREEEVEFAENGKECIEKLEEFSPDILFLDANMPEKSGWEVLEYVKEKYPNIYVILMTAEEDKKAPVSPDALLQKPFQIGDIVKTLNSIV